MDGLSNFQKLITAAFVALLFVLYTFEVWETSGRNASVRERQSYNSQTYASQANKKIKNTCLVLDGASRSKCIRDIIEATNEHGRSERDLVAQTDMALWAFWMAVISGLMFFATAFGVVFVYKTLSATREMVREAEKTTIAAQEAAEVTKEIGRHQVRAYLFIGEMAFQPIVLNRPFQIRIQLINMGKSPAKEVSIKSQTFIDDWPLPDDHILPDNWHNCGDNVIVHTGRQSDFPAQSPGLDANTIAAITARDPVRRLYVAALIEYIDIFDNRHIEQVCYGLLEQRGGLDPRAERAKKHNETS